MITFEEAVALLGKRVVVRMDGLPQELLWGTVKSLTKSPVKVLTLTGVKAGIPLYAIISIRKA